MGEDRVQLPLGGDPGWGWENMASKELLLGALLALCLAGKDEGEGGGWGQKDEVPPEWVPVTSSHPVA